MTLGVYGLVAGIVKLDDLGLWLHRKGSSFAPALGRGILWAALVDERPVGGWHRGDVPGGGGILVHGIPVVHHAVEAWAVSAAAWPAGAGPWSCQTASMRSLACCGCAGIGCRDVHSAPQRPQRPLKRPRCVEHTASCAAVMTLRVNTDYLTCSKVDHFTLTGPIHARGPSPFNCIEFCMKKNLLAVAVLCALTSGAAFAQQAEGPCPCVPVP